MCERLKEIQLIDGMLRSFLSRKRHVRGKLIEVTRQIRRNERRVKTIQHLLFIFMLEGAERQKQVGLRSHYQPSLRLLLKLLFSRILASRSGFSFEREADSVPSYTSYRTDFHTNGCPFGCDDLFCSKRGERCYCPLPSPIHSCNSRMRVIGIGNIIYEMT